MGKPYEYYFSKGGGHLPTVGGLIAEEFHDYWFKSNGYLENPEKYSSQLVNIDSPLKIEISKYLIERCDQKISNLDDNGEIKKLKSAKFDGIITTNYDVFLDRLFPELIVFIGQEELLFSNPQLIGEIYKIHGSCTKPNSLILTTRDFEEFNSRNVYLASKLLTIFVEHPIIFMGYSLEDDNIQEILNAIAFCLKNENIHKIKDRLIFVIWDEKHEGDKFYTSNYVTKDKSNIPITIIRTDDFTSIYEALGTIERKLPVRILRNLKEQFYEFILTNKPSQSCKVIFDIEDSEKLSDLECVVGVGVISKIGSLGYKGIVRDDIIKDLIFEDSRCDAEKILKNSMPYLLSGQANLPIFKYLRKAGYLSDNKLVKDDLDEKIIERAQIINSDFFKPISIYSKHEPEVKKYSGINELRQNYDTYHMMFYIPLLGLEKINIDELSEFLSDSYKEFESENAPLYNYRSYYRKLVCLFDWLKYGAGDTLTIVDE